MEKDHSASSSIIIDHSVVQSNLQSPQNNGYTNLLAGKWIEVRPNSEVKPNSILEISPTGMNCNTNYTTEASNVAISSICEGNGYQNQKFVSKKLLKNSKTSDKDLNSLVVHPNPADDFIRVSMINTDLPKGLKVSIHDLTGSLIISKQIDDRSEFIQIETSRLIPGVYIVQATTKDMNTIKKIVIK